MPQIPALYSIVSQNVIKELMETVNGGSIPDPRGIQWATQDSYIRAEARMLEIATRARIFGYDAPVLEDKRYQEALSGLQSRGGDIRIIANARQLLKSQSTFRNFEVRVAPHDFLVDRGARIYGNGEVDLAVYWDTAYLSQVERDVFLRGMMILNPEDGKIKTKPMSIPWEQDPDFFIDLERIVRNRATEDWNKHR